MERLGHRMMHGKVIKKPGINAWDSQSFQGHCPVTPQGRLTAPHMNLPVAMTNVLTRVELWPKAIKLNA